MNTLLNKKNIKESYLYPIVALNKFLPHKTRHFIYKSTFTLFLIALFIFIIANINKYLSIYNVTLPIDILIPLTPLILGLMLTTLSISLCIFSLEIFYRSLYFSFLDKRFSEDENTLASIEVLNVFEQLKNNDIVRAFLKTTTGVSIMKKCGINKKEVSTFIKKHPRKSLDKELATTDIYTLKQLANLLFDNDEAFKGFLFRHKVKKSDFLGATLWVVNTNKNKTISERWWSKGRLSEINKIADTFSYGKTYMLDKYSSDITYRQRQASNTAYKKTSRLILSALQKTSEANVLIVGAENIGLSSFIKQLPGLLRINRRFVLLDTNMLVAEAGNKNSFEQILLRIMEEARSAGNVILVIKEMPSFILSAKIIGVDVSSLLDPFLLSQEINLIAFSDKRGYLGNISNNETFTSRFEKVQIEESEKTFLVEELELTADKLEKIHNITISYPAIISSIESAEAYFQSQSILNKAIDLLSESVVLAKRNSVKIVKEAEILSLVQTKTNIPMGVIDINEKNKLNELENILHEKVVGQNEAISVISNAMRRARTGIRDNKKPIGSFLFLGPTGVGKTETAKALAELFFGSSKSINRLDMSEYSSYDALEKLIGSQSTGAVGVLTKKLREKPYSVVLLDEFEKTNPAVHDLFLQILDEGSFSDMRGRKVNARNSIFIATSNAGADIIWDMVKNKLDLEKEKKSLIQKIIERNSFKPELLNRFTAIILFHPLEKEHLQKIAEIMLRSLNTRLEQKGLRLNINKEMIEHVASKGYDPVFGARPMKRVIEQDIEQKVATMVINGDAIPGKEISLPF